MTRDCWITKSHWIAKYRGIAKDSWLAKCHWIAKYCGFAKDCWIAKCRWTSDVLIATICWLLTISLSLSDSEGVALIGLGGVNLDRLMAFSKFNPNFLVLPNPIFYTLSESLSSLRHFLDLWEAFLRVFSNLSNSRSARQTTALLDFVSYLPSWQPGKRLSPSRLFHTRSNLW